MYALTICVHRGRERALPVFGMQLEDAAPTLPIVSERDRLDAVLESASVDIKQAAFRSPNTNAFVERFIQTLQQECLDYFVVFGEEHMDHLVREFVTHYHEERPHQSKDNDILRLPATSSTSEEQSGRGDSSAPESSGIECRQRLGGLLKHYTRRAA